MPIIKAVMRENATDTDNTDIKNILYLASINTYFSVSNSPNDATILKSTTTNKVTLNPEIAFLISFLLKAICEAMHMVNNKNNQKLGEAMLPLLKIPVYTMNTECLDHSIKFTI